MTDSILEGYYNLNVDEFKLYENALYNNHNNNYEHEHEHEHEHEDDYAYHDEEEYFDAEFYLNNYDDHININVIHETQDKEYSIIDLVYYYLKQLFV